jgi:hypothetical protein
MRAAEVGASLGGKYGVDHAAGEPEAWFARSALALAVAATDRDARELVLAYFLVAHRACAAHARVARECARTSLASVCALLADEARLYAE